MAIETSIVNPEELPEGVPEEYANSDLTIMEHLVELRNRFVVSALALIVGVMVVLFFTWDPPSSMPNTFNILLEPARQRIDFNFKTAQEVIVSQVEVVDPVTGELVPIDPETITPETAFRDDLGLDAFELDSLLNTFAREATGGFILPIDLDDINKITTVEDAVEVLGSKSEDNFRLASFSPTDRISAIFKVSIYGGILIAMPVLIYQTLAFIVPGLTPGERKTLLAGVLGCLVFLLGGMAFAYFVVLERALGFLLGVASENVENVIGINEYISFVTRIILWIGIAYQLPMVLALMARIGLVTAGQLLRFWRYAIVLVFVIAAIATPTPDPLTQSFVAVPLLGLYFLGVLFAWILYTPRGGGTPA